jgi:dual-specificity kinase
MACILIELYTGELFFDTHENNEHLAMIEKQCGAIPKWMAEKCKASRI